MNKLVSPSLPLPVNTYRIWQFAKQIADSDYELPITFKEYETFADSDSFATALSDLISPFQNEANGIAYKDIVLNCVIQWFMQYCRRETCMEDTAYVYHEMCDDLYNNQYFIKARIKSLTESFSELYNKLYTELTEYVDYLDEDLDREDNEGRQSSKNLSTTTHKETEGTDSTSHSGSDTQFELNKDFPQTKITGSAITSNDDYVSSATKTTDTLGTQDDRVINTVNDESKNSTGDENSRASKTIDSTRSIERKGRHSSPQYLWKQYAKFLSPVFNDIDSLFKKYLLKVW